MCLHNNAYSTHLKIPVTVVKHTRNQVISATLAILSISRKSQAIAKIFTILNKVKMYIRVRINGVIRIWQKTGYAHS